MDETDCRSYGDKNSGDAHSKLNYGAIASRWDPGPQAMTANASGAFESRSSTSSFMFAKQKRMHKIAGKDRKKARPNLDLRFWSSLFRS
jgi:hypothetical protein